MWRNIEEFWREINDVTECHYQINASLLQNIQEKEEGGVPNIVTSSVSYCARMTPLDCSGCPCAAGAPHTIEGSPCSYLGSTEGRTGRLWTHHSPVGGEAGMQCRKSCSVLSLCLRLKTVKWRHFVLIDFSRSLPSGVTIDEQKRLDRVEDREPIPFGKIRPL